MGGGEEPTRQKGGLSLSTSVPNGRGTAPRPPHLWDLISATPHLERRQTPSDCCPNSPIPAKHFSQANTFQSSVAHCVCIHVRTHACTRAYMHTALLHLRALHVPGLSLNISIHPALPILRTPPPGGHPPRGRPANLLLCRDSEDFFLMGLHTHHSRALLEAFTHCPMPPTG